MLNKKIDLTLSINKSLNNLSMSEQGPYTPMEQTVSTPVDVPPIDYAYFPPQPPGQAVHANAHNPNRFYSIYTDSDDVLTDVDEPSRGPSRHYTVSFTSQFDVLLTGIYSHIMSLPTTTPFSGTTPPSGLVNKVATETVYSMMAKLSTGIQVLYDTQGIVTADSLRNAGFQPILLQLIRKRLLELCAHQKAEKPLPPSTAVSVLGDLGRQLLISNLLLTDANVALLANRSRLSLLNLRKQSLTRNNSYSGNNWLHIGNLNNLRPPNLPDKFLGSSDSLQSMQDFVPQSFISRSGQLLSNLGPVAGMGSGSFNSQMMDYQTPPASHKGLVLSQYTPPQAHGSTGHLFVPPLLDLDDFNFARLRSISNASSRGAFPRPLTINTDAANLGTELDSPFMSATTPSEEYHEFMCPSGGSSILSLADSPREDHRINLPAQISLSEKKRDSLKMKRGIH